MKARFVPYLLATLLMSFTLLGTLTTYRNYAKQKELVLSAAHRQVLREISNRLETYINVLLQTRSMFYVTKEVDRREFRDYIRKLEIQEKYPGLQGMVSPERFCRGR